MEQPRRFARDLAMRSVFAMMSNRDIKPKRALDNLTEHLAEARKEQEPDSHGEQEEPNERTLDTALSIAETFEAERREIESRMGMFLDRGKRDVSAMEKAAISAALAERRASPKVPPKVLINEYIELTKKYGAKGGYRLVNGVLDSIFKDEADNPPEPSAGAAAPGE